MRWSLCGFLLYVYRERGGGSEAASEEKGRQRDRGRDIFNLFLKSYISIILYYNLIYIQTINVIEIRRNCYNFRTSLAWKWGGETRPIEFDPWPR